MNILEMVPVRTATSHPRAVLFGKMPKRSLLKRSQYFIESTEWDERYLCTRWIDKMCYGVIVISILYFATIALSSLLK
jgi:hypothetical protein